MKLYYISGPMSGYPEHNRPQFAIAAKLLRERGWAICNPIEFDEPEDRPWSEYLRKDIRALMDCAGVITLPGWQESRGASLEVHIAHALGMTVLPLSVALTMRANDDSSAPHGSAATTHGDCDDDESDRGRARRLAGGCDADPTQRSGRADDGQQEHCAAAHDAGLLRAQPSRTARQGDAAADTSERSSASLNSATADPESAADGSQKPNGDGHRSSTAPARAGSMAQREAA